MKNNRNIILKGNQIVSLVDISDIIFLLTQSEILTDVNRLKVLMKRIIRCTGLTQRHILFSLKREKWFSI